jgi:hypothetical protein
MDDIFFVLSNQRENRNQRQFGSTDRHKRKRNQAQKNAMVFAMPTSGERIRAILVKCEISCVTLIPGFWPDTRVQEKSRYWMGRGYWKWVFVDPSSVALVDSALRGGWGVGRQPQKPTVLFVQPPLEATQPQEEHHKNQCLTPRLPSS